MTATELDEILSDARAKAGREPDEGVMLGLNILDRALYKKTNSNTADATPTPAIKIP